MDFFWNSTFNYINPSHNCFYTGGKRMKIRLTPTQKELLKLAKEKGYLTLEDFNMFFTSPISRKSNLQRLIALGYLKADSVGKFKYTKKEIKE